MSKIGDCTQSVASWNTCVDETLPKVVDSGVKTAGSVWTAAKKGAESVGDFTAGIFDTAGAKAREKVYGSLEHSQAVQLANKSVAESEQYK